MGIYPQKTLFLPVEYGCVFIMVTLAYTFFTVVIPAILVLFCLFVVVDLAQDIADQIKGFLEVPQLYLSLHKKCSSHSFALYAQTVWNDVPDVHSALTLACFRIKAKILSLQKGIPILTH